MIPYEELVTALTQWRTRHGLPTGVSVSEAPPVPNFGQGQEPVVAADNMVIEDLQASDGLDDTGATAYDVAPVHDEQYLSDDDIYGNVDDSGYSEPPPLGEGFEQLTVDEPDDAATVVGGAIYTTPMVDESGHDSHEQDHIASGEVGGQTAASGEVGGQTAASGEVGGQTAASGEVGGQTAASGEVGGQTAASGEVGGQTAASGEVGGQTDTTIDIDMDADDVSEPMISGEIGGTQDPNA